MNSRGMSQDSSPLPSCGFPTPAGRCNNSVQVGNQTCELHLDSAVKDKIDAAKRMASVARSRAAKLPTAVAAEQPFLSDTQLEAIGSVLIEHGVVFALIGGAALNLYEAPVERTRDVDILVDREHSNLVRLALALNELQARIWVGVSEPDGVKTHWSAELLAAHQRFINLLTNAGPLDINYAPDGLDTGYSAVADRIVTIAVRSVRLPVAPLDAILVSKAAAGRPKDIVAVGKVRRWLATKRDT